MKPYYEHAGVTIFNTNSLEWLDSVPACFQIDAMITDPPYGVDFSGKSNKVNPKRRGGGIPPLIRQRSAQKW